MAEVARPWGVNREYDYARSLCLLHRLVNVRVRSAAGSITIDPIRNHQNLASHRGFWPALDQVSDRKIGTGVHTSKSERQPQTLDRLVVVFSKILHDVDSPIAHVADADSRRGRLGIDESAKILELRTEATAGGIVKQEEETLVFARRLVPRIPFPQFHLLIVDEMGKNISGCGMDTKVIGRGVELEPGEAPKIRLIYVRDLTEESSGNAAGIGLADLMHERLYKKIDLERTYINVLTSLNLPMGRLPIYLPCDRDAVEFALGALGSPEPVEQRVVWIRNTLDLKRIAVSEKLAKEAGELDGWRLVPAPVEPKFDATGNLSPLES